MNCQTQRQRQCEPQRKAETGKHISLRQRTDRQKQVNAMDREHQRNLTGIVAESARILREYWKLFLSLSSTLVLPLCFMILAHHLVSGPLIHKIRSDERFIESQEGSSAAEEKHESDLEVDKTPPLLCFVSSLCFGILFALHGCHCILGGLYVH